MTADATHFPPAGLSVCAALAIALATGCGGSEGREDEASAPPPQGRPNILWVVWDTTRADHLSLYGYHRRTTPFLEEWAPEGRVFEQCMSTACSTVPSHAGMFTGLLPSEHGTYFGHQWLEDENQTIAELLRDSGYQTYLWAANPHISASGNFTQGFETVEHPWDEETRQQAFRIVMRKLRRDRSTELTETIKGPRRSSWMIKAAGELAETGLLRWLDERDPEQPFFAFVNYMEAHRPFIPPTKYRRRMMSGEDLERSFVVDRSWVPMWAYNFGLHEYSEKELEIMAATYDAAVAELDELFRSLIEALQERGALEDTLVVLVADHGEHLGEHHMLDHQYSLYDGLVRVPLILHAPGRIDPGRDTRPVSNHDLFPTLLELAGIEADPDATPSAQSLLRPEEDRQRLAELPATFTEPFVDVARTYPDFDPGEWTRRLRALRVGEHKFIWSSRGDHELYDMGSDPGEERNLAEQEPERTEQLRAAMDAFESRLRDPIPRSDTPAHTLSAEEEEMLRRLGYLRESEEDAADAATGDGEADGDAGDGEADGDGR